MSQRDLALLKRNVARLRREMRLQAFEMQQLIDADLDCSGAARLLMHMQNDLRLYLEKLDGRVAVAPPHSRCA